MANGYSAGSLYLDIESVADNTIKKLDAIIERLNIINKGLGGVSKFSKLSEITSSPKNNKNDKSLKDLLNIGKWSAVLYSARRFGRVFANIAQAGSDFSETLNLWQVSMGKDFLPQATKFVNKLNEAYGISKQTLMNSQAIFKNMLGSLGQISEEAAYKLSEGITQMALDYASLYNVKFEEAMTKFQAALAGQVRPIRSVSGYDITENTLFQLYQSIGGTKTMRQLSRTEKQLLAIYAVFQQMDRSGAVGDFGRTLGSFANQSKVASDNIKEIMTFSGLIFTRWVQMTGLFQQINGFLIFIGDVLEAVASTMPDIEVPDDPFASMLDNAEKTNKEIDKIQGKLLDFDKIRALTPSDSESGGLGLDETIIKAFTGFDSVLAEVDKTSQNIANNLKIASGLFDEDGVFNKDKWDEIIQQVTDFGIALGIVFGADMANKILDFATSVEHAEVRMKLLNGVLQGLAIYAFAEAIQAFKDGDIAMGVLATSVGIVTLGWQFFNTELGKTLLLKIPTLISTIGTKFAELGKTLQTVNGFASFTVSTMASFAILDTIFSNLSEEGKQFAGVLAIILGTLVAIGGAIKGGLAGAAIAGIGVGAILAGIKSAADGFGMFANGGLPDKGTWFYAGEAGAEIVYNTPSGQSGVANVQQIAQATYAGTTQALNDWWGIARGDMPQFAPASDSGLYERVTAQAGLRGDHWSR